MQITLISKEQHAKLENIFHMTPILTLQNEGYEYIDKKKFSDDDTLKFHEVTEVLKKSISGFSSFNNFRLTKDKKIQLRFQYNWNYDGKGIPFTGVGYIQLDELLNGFNNH